MLTKRIIPCLDVRNKKVTKGISHFVPTDRLQQRAYNYIVDGVYYKLDDQLLYEEGPFDFSFMKMIDAPKTLLDSTIEIYENINKIKLSDIAMSKD